MNIFFFPPDLSHKLLLLKDTLQAFGDFKNNIFSESLFNILNTEIKHKS